MGAGGGGGWRAVGSDGRPPRWGRGPRHCVCVKEVKKWRNQYNNRTIRKIHIHTRINSSCHVPCRSDADTDAAGTAHDGRGGHGPAQVAARAGPQRAAAARVSRGEGGAAAVVYVD